MLLRRAALDLDVTTLADRVDRFRSAACAQQQVFEEDRLLLAHDVDSLTAQIGESLRLFAQREPARWYAWIEELAAELPIRLLDDGLRGVVEHAVRASFDAFRAAESTRAEHAWCDLADRFRTRTQERVDSIRGDAADLFAIDLPTLAVPTVSGEQERFFYLFLHVGSSTEGLGRLASRILPAGLVRRRMLANARRQLIREFDKHAGRARVGIWHSVSTARAGHLRRRCTLNSTTRSRASSLPLAAPRSFGPPRSRNAPSTLRSMQRRSERSSGHSRLSDDVGDHTKAETRNAISRPTRPDRTERGLGSYAADSTRHSTMSANNKRKRSASSLRLCRSRRW